MDVVAVSGSPQVVSLPLMLFCWYRAGVYNGRGGGVCVLSSSSYLYPWCCSIHTELERIMDVVAVSGSPLAVSLSLVLFYPYRAGAYNGRGGGVRVPFGSISIPGVVLSIQSWSV